MKRQNYLQNLLHYLEEFKEISISTEKSLKGIIEYYELTYNKESATDNTELLKLKNLYDKFSYYSKYVDITIDFYKMQED